MQNTIEGSNGNPEVIPTPETGEINDPKLPSERDYFNTDSARAGYKKIVSHLLWLISWILPITIALFFIAAITVLYTWLVHLIDIPFLIWITDDEKIEEIEKFLFGGWSFLAMYLLAYTHLSPRR